MSTSQKADDIWQQILQGVNSQQYMQRCPKNVLLLGDTGVGKLSLVSRLTGSALLAGHGLNFSYVQVELPSCSVPTELNFWILDGNTLHSHLLECVCPTKKAFEELTVCFVVSLPAPWDMIRSLNGWLQILDSYLRQKLKFTEAELAALRKTMLLRYRGSSDPSRAIRAASAETIGDEELLSALQHPPGTGSGSFGDIWLGASSFIVVNKCDCLPALRAERHLSDDHVDFMQMHLRLAALRVGASLLYVSATTGRNCAELKQLLVAAAFGLAVALEPQLVDPAAVIVPFGYDNAKRLQLLRESITSIDLRDDYTDVIVRPPFAARASRLLVGREPELTAEDEQVFLGRQLELLNLPLAVASAADPAAGASNAGSMRLKARAPPASLSPTQSISKATAPGALLSPAGRRPALSTSDRTMSVSSGADPEAPTDAVVSGSLGRRAGAAWAGGTSSGSATGRGADNNALASFFSSLLQKKESGK